jgi:hypothetical protein
MASHHGLDGMPQHAVLLQSRWCPSESCRPITGYRAQHSIDIQKQVKDMVNSGQIWLFLAQLRLGTLEDTLEDKILD